MPALNFDARYATAVENGWKRQTIRARRKRPFRIGDDLYHWSNQRSPKGRRLGIHKCRMVVDILIENVLTGGCTVYIAGRALSPTEANTLAHADGFRSADEMVAWLEKTYGLPFTGQVILW